MSIGAYKLNVELEGDDYTAYALVEFRDGKFETMELNVEGMENSDVAHAVQSKLGSKVIEGKTTIDDIEDNLGKSEIVREVRRLAIFQARWKEELKGD